MSGPDFGGTVKVALKPEYFGQYWARELYREAETKFSFNDADNVERRMNSLPPAELHGRWGAMRAQELEVVKRLSGPEESPAPAWLNM